MIQIAIIIFLAVFYTGSAMTGVGDFVSGFVKESFSMAPYGGKYGDHLKNWTLYYWAWWIAWAPFVGSFVARISRGRTIAENVFKLRRS